MSAVAESLSVVGTKFQVGAAACAIAAAAVVTPVVAQADPSAVVPASPMTYVLDNIPDYTFWWFGPANPDAPPRTVLVQFQPLSLIPNFFKPGFMAKTANTNLEACVLGFGVRFGPYGSVSASKGRGC